jgi:hypothetical protein
MQLSNGIANPASLWFGHLVFDGIFGIITSIIIVAVFATVSTQFAYIGLFVSARLYESYLGHTNTPKVACHSPLFLHRNPLRLLRLSHVGIINCCLFHCGGISSPNVHVCLTDILHKGYSHLGRLYLSAYLLTITYAKTSQTDSTITIIRKFATTSRSASLTCV